MYTIQINMGWFDSYDMFGWFDVFGTNAYSTAQVHYSSGCLYKKSVQLCFKEHIREFPYNKSKQYNILIT